MIQNSLNDLHDANLANPDLQFANLNKWFAKCSKTIRKITSPPASRDLVRHLH